MSTDRIAVIDVETTGLQPWRHDRIIEIAIVVMDRSGEVLAEYDTLLNPQRDIGPTDIHKISARDVLHAPEFAAIAGDVIEILGSASVVAGHNVRFDRNFLATEYRRIGLELPQIPYLCTCDLFGRSGLQACCREMGLSFDGMPHRALSDARVTAKLLAIRIDSDPHLLEAHRFVSAGWPSIPPSKTPCFRRENATFVAQAPPRFLQRLTADIHHDVDAATPNVLAYMALIDRVLEDRLIDANEEITLVDAAQNLQLSRSQLEAAHAQYLHSIVVAALSDGRVTESERRDLHLVAGLLGHDIGALDAMLETASAQFAAVNLSTVKQSGIDSSLMGKSVCFTGQLQSQIDGKPITRDLAEALASQAGLTVVSGVTKKLDLLVLADPATQSGKAKKARDYGTRLLADTVFWRMLGVTID
jgi:DNA polymerase-3 subunit epsilon